MFSVWMGESHAHLADLTNKTCEASLQPTVVNTFDFNRQLLGRWGPGIWNGS